MLEGVTHVVHCAATYNQALPLEICLRVNRDGALLLCDEAGRRGIKQFLHISTGGVYGHSVYTPMREDHPHHPPDAYSLSKEAGESAVVHKLREYGIPLTIFRPTGVYGPHSTYAATSFYVIPSILRYYGIKRLPGFTGGKLVTYVHVKDISGAIAFCLDNPAAFNEDFNLAEDKPMYAGEFFDCIYKLFDIDVAFHLPYPKALMEGSAKAALKLPSFLYRFSSLPLDKMWERIVRERGLVPKLAPRLDQDFMYFLLGDHYLDSSKIRGIGYVNRYPNSLERWDETIDWYRQERWLP